MKTYSIGRDLNCDIVFNDTTDVISRRHALLNVTSSGKMTIIDQSSNGTYVNGIRISQNVPVPITRKDTISLAHVAKLDWNQVPKENKWVFYVVSVVVILAVLAGVVYGTSKKKDPGPDDVIILANVDSTDIKRKEMERRDSVEKAALRDSIKMLETEKARQDSISRAKEKAKKQESEKKETQTEPEKSSKQNKKKTIG